jgi:tetratricopeptide (TPR) repeat protein
MGTEKKRSIRLVFALCWLGALLLEGVAVWIFVAAGGDVLPPLSVGFHVAAAFLLLVVPVLPGAGDYPHTRYNSFLGGWLTLFLPVVGILGSLAIAATTALLKSKGTVSDFQVMTAYRLAQTALPEFTEDVPEFIEEEINIEPMLDILRGENTDFKRGVVKYLQQLGSPAAIGVLKQSLSDASPEIQYYTHAALENLESVWMERIEEARKALEAEDANEKRVPLVMALGRTYKGYANSGLVADETRFHYYEQARKTFEQGLSREPDNSEIVLALGRICLEEKDLATAEEYFTRGLSLPGGLVDSLLGLCQVYFEGGNLKALAETSRRMREEIHHAHPDPLKDSLIHFWAAEQEG